MNSVQLDDKFITPSKIVCIGRNYVEHIQELNNDIPSEPVVFIKPNSAISSQLYAKQEQALHYEGELCFVVKAGALYGIGFGLDLTKRALQSELKAKGLPWERAKAFNHSAVFSHFVQCDKPISYYHMALYIDDKLTQVAEYDLMIHKPEALFIEIERFFTLEDGDIIMTGTPKGVGEVNAGAKFTAKVYCQQHLIIEQSWLAQ